MKRMETYTPCLIFIGFDNPPNTSCNGLTNGKWKCSNELPRQDVIKNPIKAKPKTHPKPSTKLYDLKKHSPKSRFFQPKDDFIESLFPNDKKTQNFWNSLSISKNFLQEREAKLEVQNKIKQESPIQQKEDEPTSSYDSLSMFSLEQEFYDFEEKFKGSTKYYDSKYFKKKQSIDFNENL